VKNLCVNVEEMDEVFPFKQHIHNPPHPGEFITEVYLEPYNISGRELAQKLDVAASTLSAHS
jgi:hypothetical protein